MADSDSASPQPGPQQDHGQRDIAIHAYRRVFDEFRVWERGHSHDSVASLAQPLVGDSDDYLTSMYTESFPESSLGSDFLPFTVSEYDEDGYELPRGQVIDCQIELDVFIDREEPRNSNRRRRNRGRSLTPSSEYFGLSPYPEYQACTPVANNVHSFDLSTNQTYFIPFADQLNFPIDDYLVSFGELAWQDDFHDPDLEAIQIETFWRLHLLHRFSVNDFSSTRLFRPLRTGRASGLLWEHVQRDPLLWPGMSLKRDLRLFGPAELNQFLPDHTSLKLFDEVNVELPKFCPNLNCLHHSCKTHKFVKYHELDSRESPLRDDALSSMLRKRKLKPCGVSCFQHKLKDSNLKEEAFESMLASQTSDVDSILDLEPDLLPCYVATICRVTCLQAFSRQKEYVIHRESEKVSDSRTLKILQGSRRRPKMTPDKKEEDRHKACVRLGIEDSDKKTGIHKALVDPCRHRGPCSKTKCSCFQSKRSCQRSCHCEPDCPRRHPGCSCAPRGSPCTDTSQCICLEERRECDPEVCGTCRAKDSQRRDINPRRRPNLCNNVWIQRGSFAEIEVKLASFGLGAFARDSIQTGEYIGEYPGELIPISLEDEPPDTILRNFVHRNYSFDYTDTDVLDAAFAGGPTRFLNDPRPNFRDASNKDWEHKINVAADTLVVNDELRIGFYASEDIDKGAELFLSYGDNFWAALQSKLSSTQAET